MQEDWGVIGGDWGRFGGKWGIQRGEQLHRIILVARVAQ